MDTTVQEFLSDLAKLRDALWSHPSEAVMDKAVVYLLANLELIKLYVEGT
jgi:hypothetical protein